MGVALGNACYNNFPRRLQTRRKSRGKVEIHPIILYFICCSEEGHHNTAHLRHRFRWRWIQRVNVCSVFLFKQQYSQFLNFPSALSLSPSVSFSHKNTHFHIQYMDTKTHTR